MPESAVTPCDRIGGRQLHARVKMAERVNEPPPAIPARRANVLCGVNRAPRAVVGIRAHT